MWGKVFWLSQGRILAFAKYPAMFKTTQWKQIFTSHFPKYNFTTSLISSHLYLLPISSHSFCFLYCCSSVTKSCPTLCDPMDCSMPGFPILHHLLEFAQTQVHWDSDAIQTSHPLSPPSPLAFNLSQHQGLYIRQPKVLELQHQSFQLNIWGWFPFRLTGLTASYFKQNINHGKETSFPIYYSFLPVITNELSLFLSSGNLSTQILYIPPPQEYHSRISPVVQWPRLHASSERDTGWIP